MIEMTRNWKTQKGLFIEMDHVSYATPYYLPGAKPEHAPVATEIGLSGGQVLVVDCAFSEFVNRWQEGKLHA